MCIRILWCRSRPRNGKTLHQHCALWGRKSQILSGLLCSYRVTPDAHKLEAAIWTSCLQRLMELGRESFSPWLEGWIAATWYIGAADLHLHELEYYPTLVQTNRLKCIILWSSCSPCSVHLLSLDLAVKHDWRCKYQIRRHQFLIGYCYQISKPNQGVCAKGYLLW